MKKIFTLIALLMMATWVGWGQEDNTKTVQIKTAEELRDFAQEVNKNTDSSVRWDVTLEADIDLGGESNPWTPIKDFRGTFDGGNHIISGLYITGVEDFVGFFGEVQNGDIKNLTIRGKIENCIGRIGGICGQHQGTIINCHNEANITVDEFSMSADKSSGSITVGGISGYGGSFENCSNSGNITINVQKSSNVLSINVGGIGAQCSSTTNCYNSGTITLNGNNYGVGSISIGGVIGSGVSIENCYNIGNIKVKELSLEYPNNMLPAFFISGVVAESHGGWGIEAYIHYCYNTGNISIPDNFSSSEDVFVGVGSILGGAIGEINAISNSYYLTQDKDNIGAIGMNTITGKKIEAKDKSAFKSGEVAWLLRKAGGNFGQGLDEDGNSVNEENQTPVLLAFNEGTEVYKLTLSAEENSGITIDKDEATIYRNAIESNLLSETKYNSITKETGKDIVWKDEAEKVVVSGNKYTPTEDIELTATINKVYNIKTIVTPEGAGDITVKESAAAGETISFTVMANEGYEFVSVEGATFEEGEEAGSYTFTMPAEDITITATFKATETGGDDDDEGEGGISTKRYQLFLADQDFYLNDEYDAEGLVLYSLHDKRYTKAGSSFTIWFEKHGEVNEGARVFISNRANGEYKEVKLDEVSGYYQIRNVQSNIYVKLYTEEGFPVANETIEATDARAYAQANKIVVITPEPTDVQIISMAGAVVATAQVAGQQEFANLAEGVYIVRMGKEIVKLQVRN